VVPLHKKCGEVVTMVTTCSPALAFSGRDSASCLDARQALVWWLTCLRLGLWWCALLTCSLNSLNQFRLTSQKALKLDLEEGMQPCWVPLNPGIPMSVLAPRHRQALCPGTCWKGSQMHVCLSPCFSSNISHSACKYHQWPQQNHAGTLS